MALKQFMQSLNIIYFLKNNSLVGNKCYGYIIKGLETTNIDTKKDLEFFKFLIDKKKK